jgi:hypothetical protein
MTMTLRHRRAATMGSLFVLACAALAFLRLMPPTPRGIDAPASDFSAGRAMRELAALVGDGAPHPPGTEAHERVRARIVDELRARGYSPEESTSFECDDSGSCAKVTNVVARLAGSGDTGKEVVLTAHYDSVAAGPGAADDAAGVAAILEIARALRARPVPKNDVVFLLDDGEEATGSGSHPPGLRGARVFLGEATRIGAIVNLEARGTSGPSILFEMSRDDAWLVSHLSAIPRPVTNSLLAMVYDALPNATDLTVYKQAGVSGINFAFIDDAANYHTPNDRLSSVAPGSVQQQGDSALGVVIALAGADLSARHVGDAVFFDVLSAFVVSWPVKAAIPLAVLALLLVLVSTGLALRRAEMRIARVALGCCAWLLSVVAGAAASFALVAVMRTAGALPTDWVAHPAASRTAVLAAAAAAAVTIGAAAARRIGSGALWHATWLLFAVAGLALAVAAPGASYLFVVPALVAGVLGTSWGRTPSDLRLLPVFAVPAAVVALLWVEPTALVASALGASGLPIVGTLACLAATSIAPLAACVEGRERWTPALLAAVGLAAAAMACAQRPFDAAAAEGFNIALHEDASTGTARWLIDVNGPVPGDRSGKIESAFPWGPRPAFEWWAGDALVRPAVAPHLDPPRLTIEDRVIDSSGKATIRARLESMRHAPSAGVYFAPGARIESVTMEGRRLADPDQNVLEDQHGWRIVECETLPPGGAELGVVLAPGTIPVEAIVLDRSGGVVLQGDEAPRRDERAAPYHRGDATVVSQRVVL